MSARAAPASMTTRRKAAHRIADRVLFNFLLSLYGRSRLNRNANRRPRCGDRSGGVFRKCSPPRLSPEADGSGGDSSPKGSGWGVFRKRYRPRPARKRGDSSPRGSGWGVFRKRYRPRPAPPPRPPPPPPRAPPKPPPERLPPPKPPPERPPKPPLERLPPKLPPERPLKPPPRLPPPKPPKCGGRGPGPWGWWWS